MAEINDYTIGGHLKNIWNFVCFTWGYVNENNYFLPMAHEEYIKDD